jgi:hypothetical protein
MAYVAISNNFMYAVRENIRSMRRKEYNSVPEVDKKLRGDHGTVVAAFWQEHLNLKDVIPKMWKREISSARIKVTMGDGAEHRVFDVNLEPPGEAPPIGVSKMPVFPHDAPEVKAFVDYDSLQRDIAARWDKVESDLTHFLGKCKSLNEALKLWPQIEMYIPREYMNRVNEKRERTKGNDDAAEALKALDTDHLTTAAVLARMSSGV